jgi:hypothetical protein
MKMNRVCQHCGEANEKKLTEHHVHPLCHFGSRRTNRWTVTYCQKCHREIETGILFLESRLGGVGYGTRFKLHSSEYENIVRQFSKKKFCD